MHYYLYDTLMDATFGQWELIIRILLAAICGAGIGLERSRRQKEAGIRTHIIVCIGAALIMIISKYGFFDVVVENSVQVDASRVASNVVTGISFLGAGVIFLKGGAVKGLTTSAGLWATAAVGLASGAGMYTVGIFTTILIVVMQNLLHKYNLSTENIENSEIHMVIDDNADILNKIKDYLLKNQIVVEDFHLKKNADGTLTYDATVKHLKNLAVEDLMLLVHDIPEIKDFSVTT